MTTLSDLKTGVTTWRTSAQTANANQAALIPLVAAALADMPTNAAIGNDLAELRAALAQANAATGQTPATRFHDAVRAFG